MKIKTKEQYDKRFERIGKRKAAKAYSAAASFRFDSTWGLSPNHHERKVDIDEVFGAIYRPKPAKNKNKGIVQVGASKDCPHVLVKWYTELNEDGTEDHFPRAYPCLVHHGWEKSKGMHLRPAMGKKGEHEDSLGRKW